MKYFKMRVSPRNQQDSYIVTFLPAFSNVDDKRFLISKWGYHAPLYIRGKHINFGKKTVKCWFENNRGLDKYPRDGKITLSELDDVIQMLEFGIVD